VPRTLAERALAADRDAAPPQAEPDLCCAPAEEPPLRAEDAARYAAVLKALADPHRLRMVSLLAAQPPDEPLCVCDVEASFDLSQPTISHHLRVLREAGLVTVTKRGLWHYYTLVRSGLAPLQQLLGALSSTK
jgi:ArsR family transcriptional regulator